MRFRRGGGGGAPENKLIQREQMHQQHPDCKEHRLELFIQKSCKTCKKLQKNGIGPTKQDDRWHKSAVHAPGTNLSKVVRRTRTRTRTRGACLLLLDKANLQKLKGLVGYGANKLRRVLLSLLTVATVEASNNRPEKATTSTTVLLLSMRLLHHPNPSVFSRTYLS